MGIGDWAQSPIPNPQSPIKFDKFYHKKIKNKKVKIIIIKIKLYIKLKK